MVFYYVFHDGFLKFFSVFLVFFPWFLEDNVFLSKWVHFLEVSRGFAFCFLGVM